MATVFKCMYFKKQSFLTRNEAELPDAIAREANKAVCVCVLIKQALMYQWLNFGQFALF